MKVTCRLVEQDTPGTFHCIWETANRNTQRRGDGRAQYNHLWQLVELLNLVMPPRRRIHPTLPQCDEGSSRRMEERHFIAMKRSLANSTAYAWSCCAHRQLHNPSLSSSGWRPTRRRHTVRWCGAQNVTSSDIHTERMIYQCRLGRSSVTRQRAEDETRRSQVEKTIAAVAESRHIIVMMNRSAFWFGSVQVSLPE